MENQNSRTPVMSPYTNRVSTVSKYDNSDIYGNIDTYDNYDDYGYGIENNNIQGQPISKDPNRNTQYINTDYNTDDSVNNNLIAGNPSNGNVDDYADDQVVVEYNSPTTNPPNGSTTSSYTNIPSFSSNINPTYNKTMDEIGSDLSKNAGVENKESDSSLQTIIIVLTLVILALFSLSLIKLKNRNNDKDPVSEKSIYDKNKPLPIITKDVMNRNSQDQVINVQSTNEVNMNYNNDMNNNYGLPDIVEYDQLQYGYDNRMSFLALGDSAIEPRQATLNLKEEVIKKSKDNMPIPLVHISNENGLNIEEESEINEEEGGEEEDNINLKVVEPLPGTVIPSKKKSPLTHNFIHDSHGLFKKVKNKLKSNSDVSSKSTLSPSSKSNNDQNSNNQYTILTTPKE